MGCGIEGMKYVRLGRSRESYSEEKNLGGSEDREDILAFIVEMGNRGGLGHSSWLESLRKESESEK